MLFRTVVRRWVPTFSLSLISFLVIHGWEDDWASAIVCKTRDTLLSHEFIPNLLILDKTLATAILPISLCDIWVSICRDKLFSICWIETWLGSEHGGFGMLQESSRWAPLRHLPLHGAIHWLHNSPLLIDLLHELKDLIRLLPWLLNLLLTTLETNVHGLGDEFWGRLLIAFLVISVTLLAICYCFLLLIGVDSFELVIQTLALVVAHVVKGWSYVNIGWLLLCLKKFLSIHLERCRDLNWFLLFLE